MKKYRITYKDSQRSVTGEHPAPERAVRPGDVYEFVHDVWTMGNHHYKPGDRMSVLERTQFAPHGFKSEIGNLLIAGPYGTSVWSCFDACLAEGRLKLVGSP